MVENGHTRNHSANFGTQRHARGYDSPEADKMKLQVFHNIDPSLMHRLDRFDAALKYIIDGIKRMTVDTSRLAADITANADAIAALTSTAETIVACNLTLAAQLRDLQNTVSDSATQAALDELAAKLEANTATAAGEVEKIKFPPEGAAA